MPRQCISNTILAPAMRLAVLWMLALADPAAATVDPGTSGLCDMAARRAARAHDVPLDVLRAITRVETGRSSGGALEPWPWTVNMEGVGHWFPSQTAAQTYVFERFKSGARSFDLGCFQINYRWHSQAFRSIDDMFDPEINADYAARFLKDLYGELGSWKAAAGAFHSRTQSLADAYAARFETTRVRLEDAAPEPRTGSLTAARARPLIALGGQTPAGGTRLGSLVATGQAGRAFIPFN
ncbi:transglycosylase SLT domain-containing protein [Ruegeria sp. WL0004]|uniref:Transglycosylase SLT domain-containing protein n=1 Tax=Ruegeria marisflavi TaxID=2984152 RepID=A0ABT2WKR4_9RHOB|nr:transglycosylase SLT domain-containing protein [Ruegeria sp. WL0004]MCU9836401.1 transglycosylase SLT domain-containing protein [Ruegeria sp. WL0004]